MLSPILNLIPEVLAGPGGQNTPTPAAETGTGDTISLEPAEGLAGTLKGLTMAKLIGALIQLALVIAAIVFFFVLVIGGIRWIVSGGDKAQTETARNQITAALVGLVIVFSAWAIIKLIGSFFGVGLSSLQLPHAL